MEIQDINIDFFWEKRTKILLDAPDPFDEKWDEEILKLYTFTEKEPIPKVIELMVIAYKNKYPRDYFSFLNNKIFKLNVKANNNNIQKFNKSYMKRKDMESYAEKEKIAKGEFEYASEIILEFVDNQELEKAIERALVDKNYTKNSNGNKTIYEVDKSPISKLEVTKKSFKLVVNEDYYEYFV